MKKLLITGFEPFGGESVNPSWEAVTRLPAKIGDFVLTKHRLPVIFTEAAQEVLNIAEDLCPDVILCIGQAGGRDAVTPEFLGINLRHATIPDNAGQTPQDQPIFPGEDCAVFSTLPVRKISDKINDCGVLSRVSYSAGTYVCNDVLYTLLHRYKNTLVKVGFIHIPYCTEQNKQPAMSMEQIQKALTVAIETID